MRRRASKAFLNPSYLIIGLSCTRVSRVTQRVRKSRFIRLFDRTPNGIVCPHFWLLAWADGCPYRCAYCYLLGTFRGHVEPVVFSNLDRLDSEIDRFLASNSRCILNAGELTDSLAITDTVPIRLIRRFARQDKSKLLLLTKSANVRNLLNLDHNGQTIVSFSINAIEVSKRFENGAPGLSERLEAAAMCKDAGYPVRIRLDPMIPIEGWQVTYEHVVGEINILNPERVTLGALRYFPVAKVFARKLGRDVSVFDYAVERCVDGRRRVPKLLRIEMYRTALKRLKVPAGVCKETKDVVRLLDLNQRCNCTL